MSFRPVFLSRRPRIVAIGIPILVGVILFCAAAFALSPVQANDEQSPQAVSSQPEPTVVPAAQTDVTIYLPLIAHKSLGLDAAHEETPPALVVASSDHSGHSTTPPPTVNNHTFVADEGVWIGSFTTTCRHVENTTGLRFPIITHSSPDKIVRPAHLRHGQLSALPPMLVRCIKTMRFKA